MSLIEINEQCDVYFSTSITRHARKKAEGLNEGQYNKACTQKGLKGSTKDSVCENAGMQNVHAYKKHSMHNTVGSKMYMHMCICMCACVTLQNRQGGRSCAGP